MRERQADVTLFRHIRMWKYLQVAIGEEAVCLSVGYANPRLTVWQKASDSWLIRRAKC